MKTWAKTLCDALPNAEHDVIESLMQEYCPHVLFGEDAPIYRGGIMITDGEACRECWDSCDSKCRWISCKNIL